MPKTWIVKTAGAVKSEPISNRAWQEVVDDFDATLQFAAQSEDEDAVVDMWLEEPQSFMGGEEVSPSTGRTGSMVRRATAGGNGLQRFDSTSTKQASTSRWDEEFSNAQNHAKSVLANLGNGR